MAATIGNIVAAEPGELKLQIAISSDKTVLELKQAIAEKSDVEADRQRLVYSGVFCACTMQEHVTNDGPGRVSPVIWHLITQLTVHPRTMTRYQSTRSSHPVRYALVKSVSRLEPSSSPQA
jgi:hypothetical protein